MIGSDTGGDFICETSVSGHNIYSDMIYLNSWQTLLKSGYVGLTIKWSLPFCAAPFYTKNFSPYLKVFLPLNISVKKHRPPHGGEAIFQVVWIFNKEDGHTTVLCGTLLYRGNKSNSRAVSPHGVWGLQIGLQSDFLADIPPPSIILLNYIYVSGWVGGELYHGEM